MRMILIMIRITIEITIMMMKIITAVTTQQK